MHIPGRIVLATLMAALLTASGCFSRTPTAVRPKLKASSSPKVVKSTPKPSAVPTVGSPTTPRLVERTPGPSATPNATKSTVPSPALPQTPLLIVQPIALNPLGSIGLAAETENYAVVSSATSQSVAELSISVDEAGGYRLASQHTLTPSQPVQDPHTAFQHWQASLPTPNIDRHRPSPYSLQQSVALVKGSTLPFWVITSFSGKTFEDKKITAKVQEIGSHCYVVVDQDTLANPLEAALIGARAKEIVKTFDERIYPNDTRIFGSEANPGVDKDPKIFILLTPAVGNYGADATLGYFSQRDEYVPKAGETGVFAHSNAKEMIYVSSRIVLKGSPDDYMGTIAHEFQHMINYNQKVLVGGNKASDDLWIDEGMAMYAIEANGFGLKAGGAVLGNHVKRFMGEPEAFSLVDWDRNPEGIGYGPVYLFMVYLADRFGETIIKDIVTTSKIGISNIDAVLNQRGATLAQVFHDWTLANLLDGRNQVTDPHYNYTSLEMTGANGLTDLPGFRTQALTLPGTATFPLRPYVARYLRLPDGLIAPHFTATAGSAGKVTVEPRQVLPQEDF